MMSASGVILENHLTHFNLFAYKMVANMDVLGPLVKLGILGQSNPTLIVLEDLDRFVLCHFSKLAQEDF